MTAAPKWSAIAGIALVVIFGLVVLPLPFYGDQALFAVYGERITAGGVLYRDLWDPKQPATFLFYALGGSVFGFGEVGLHLFELVYWVGFIVLVMRWTRRIYSLGVTPVLVGVLSVGIVYLNGDSTVTGQTELLVGFPLFVTVWFLYSSMRPTEESKVSMLLAGVFSGFVLLFKFVFGPILIALWVFTLRRTVRPWECLGRLVAGTAVPLAVFAAYLALNGALGDFLWASFVYPLKALGVPGAQKGVGELVRLMGSFAIHYALTGAFAALGLWRYIREPSPRNEWVSLAVIWLVAGTVVIIAQRTAWWGYHAMLLLIPVALIAGYGIEELAEHWSSLSRVRLIALLVAGALLLVPAGGAFARQTDLLVRHRFALSTADRASYREAADPGYAARARYGAFLTQLDTQAGPIYVYGSPLYYFFSGRPSASRIHGWSTQYWSQDMWLEVLDDLAETQPPFVLMAREERVERTHPETLDFLLGRYVILNEDPQLGTWYQLPSR
ncbi:MAG: hypothetical protein HKN74_12170 [Acidimicrobiia bacterium]|nr:glycosyltransferase family 39 protein [Acidimicrobiia bacterium]NNF11031.1 hypothetical protein [Acidimicrobiia bacterium]